MASGFEETDTVEALCVVLAAQDNRDTRDTMMESTGGVRTVVVSKGEMVYDGDDDELDDGKSLGEEEGRLLVSLYSKAGRPWPHERNSE